MSYYPFFGNPAVYVDPAIVTFVATPALAERGSSVPSVVLNWSIAKTPDVLKMNGVDIATNTKQTEMVGPFTDDASFKLVAGDKQKNVQAKATITFCNNIHYGFVDAAPTDSAGVNALDNKVLQISRKHSVQIGSPEGKVFCYAYPARLGAAKVSADVPSDQWQPVANTVKFTHFASTTVSVTNGSGFTEDYTVLTFTDRLAGSTAVHVG